MNKGSYKKEDSACCLYCDYCTCRKGHSCSYYKKWVKRKNNKSTRRKLKQKTQKEINNLW